MNWCDPGSDHEEATAISGGGAGKGHSGIPGGTPKRAVDRCVTWGHWAGALRAAQGAGPGGRGHTLGAIHAETLDQCIGY